MTYDYLPYYEESGIQCVVSPLLDDAFLQMSRDGRLGARARRFVGSAIQRIRHVLRSSAFDVVVLEKDVIPYFPYSLEALLFRLNSNVIVMYDEATNRFYEEHDNPLVRFLTRHKIDRIMRRSAHIVVWNPVMREFAAARNQHVTEVTTGIDLRRYQGKSDYSPESNTIRIGWIGSPSGFPYLHDLDPVFQQLSERYDIELYVVSSNVYEPDGIPVNNRRWSVATEVADLTAMDIGIMPLPDDEWASGKSGCKMLQYMGVGLPVVVSPVGVNESVISHGNNGFHAASQEQWVQYLSLLIEQEELRKKLGQGGRKYIEVYNSQEKIAEDLTRILSQVATSSSHQ